MADYTEEELSRAVSAAQGDMSIRCAARLWGVPWETVRDRIRGSESHSNAKEPFQRLTRAQEGHLRDWILAQAALGLPPTHTQLREFAVRILKQANDEDSLGTHWIDGFLLRNPEITLWKGKTIASERINGANANTIKEFFYLLGLPAVKKIDPANRWNMDESGIQEGDSGRGLVLGNSEKKVHLKKGSSKRSWTTIIECISAIGKALDPLVIFKGKSIQQQWFPSEIADFCNWHFEAQQSGWTDDSIALRWLKEVFIPGSRTEAKKPRLLIIDSHGSHTTNDFL